MVDVQLTLTFIKGDLPRQREICRGNGTITDESRIQRHIRYAGITLVNSNRLPSVIVAMIRATLL